MRNFDGTAQMAKTRLILALLTTRSSRCAPSASGATYVLGCLLFAVMVGMFVTVVPIGQVLVG
jgi:hypothetical protein